MRPFTAAQQANYAWLRTRFQTCTRTFLWPCQTLFFFPFSFKPGSSYLGVVPFSRPMHRNRGIDTFTKAPRLRLVCHYANKARASYSRPEATCPLCYTSAMRFEIDNERKREREEREGKTAILNRFVDAHLVEKGYVLPRRRQWNSLQFLSSNCFLSIFYCR